MPTKLKDLDGARVVHIEARGGSVFVWGRGFNYEFDRAIFLHAVERETSPDTVLA